MKRIICLITAVLMIATVTAFPVRALEYSDGTALYTENGLDMSGSPSIYGDVVVGSGSAGFAGSPRISGALKLAEGVNVNKGFGINLTTEEYVGEAVDFPSYSFAQAPDSSYFEENVYSDGTKNLTVTYYSSNSSEKNNGYTLSENAYIDTLTVRPSLTMNISVPTGETRVIRVKTLSVMGSLLVSGGGKVVMYVENMQAGTGGYLNADSRGFKNAESMTLILTDSESSALSNFSRMTANVISYGSLSISGVALTGNVYVCGSSFMITGSSHSVNGLVYAPEAKVQLLNSATVKGVVVAGSAVLGGNAVVRYAQTDGMDADSFAAIVSGFSKNEIVGMPGSSGDTIKVVRYDVENNEFDRGTMKIKEHTPLGLDVKYFVLDETSFTAQDKNVSSKTQKTLQAIAGQTASVFEYRSGDTSLYPFGRVDAQAYQYALTIAPYVVPFLEAQGISQDTMWLVWGDRAGAVEMVWIQAEN